MKTSRAEIAIPGCSLCFILHPPSFILSISGREEISEYMDRQLFLDSRRYR